MVVYPKRWHALSLKPQNKSAREQGLAAPKASPNELRAGVTVNHAASSAALLKSTWSLESTKHHERMYNNIFTANRTLSQGVQQQPPCAGLPLAHFGAIQQNYP